MAQIILDSNNNLIQGDFDNATLNNRTKLQTTTTNATTNVYVVPNGSSTSAGVSVANNSNLTNASKIVMATNGSTDTQIISGVNGSGTYLPLSFYTNDTLAMQVDTSQRVGIGTSNPYALLSVGPRVNQAQATTGMSVHISGANSDIFSAGNLNVNSNSSQGADIGGSIGLGGLYSTTAGGISFAQISGRKENGTDNNTSGYLSFCTRINGGNTLERMRIDSSGNVLIGQSTNANGAKLAITGNGGGTTDDLTFNSTASTSDIQSYNSKPLCLNRFGNEVYINGSTDRGNFALQVNSTGVWGAGAYTNGSDARIKEDIAPINSCLDIVTKLNPVTYKYKEDWSTDQSTQTGFVAQDLLVALEGENYVDGVVKQDSEYMSVAYQNIIPILTKAIQEQQAIINELKTRIEALESK